MATNYIGSGNEISAALNSDSETWSSGGVVIMNNVIGVAINDIPVGTTGPVAVEGEWKLPKNSSEAIDQYDLVVWDVSVGEFRAQGFSTATGDITGGAICTVAAASDDTTVIVKLLPGKGAIA